MDCCQCRGIESRFDRQRVMKKLVAYRENGPDETTRVLLDALKAEGVAGMTLLDIGGGVGVIQHELLAAGAASAQGVEASAASVELARAEAVRQGHAHRLSGLHGDFATLAPQIGAADIVTLDRVICCYHDMRSLVEPSAGRARRLYGVVYPRDTWWMALYTLAENVGYRLQGNPFRVFVHSVREIDALIRRQGLRPAFQTQTRVWRIEVYRRAA